MENLRSIGFVYKKEDSYEAQFLKEFFSWIGFACADFRSGKNSYSGLDIIVSLNGGIPSDEQEYLKETYGLKIYELKIKERNQTADTQVLEYLLNQITSAEEHKNMRKIFYTLAEIYSQNQLTDILYGYTSVLSTKMPENIIKQNIGRLEITIEKIKNVAELIAKEDGIEYLLYAKYRSFLEVNKYLYCMGRIERYDIGQSLININEIKNIDKGFYMADYLKAITANESCMYNAQTYLLLENCIIECKIDAVRSNFYYALGKCDLSQERTGNSFKAFRDAFKLNPNSLKTLFMLAVSKKNSGDIQMAKDFLQKIIDLWEDEKMEYTSPQEIETEYKAEMLMANTVKELKDHAKRLLVFTDPEQDIDKIKETSFIKRMYHNPEYIQAVLDAMRCRVCLSHEKKIYEGKSV